MALVLYSYFRSSAAYRVRIALNIKNIDYRIETVHLLKNGGEHHESAYRQVNPQGLIPALVDGGSLLTQSSAIIEYLDELYPTPALLPKNPVQRAFVRSLAQLIACEIHPLNNLRVLDYLKTHTNQDITLEWYQHWIQEGFQAIEKLLKRNRCYGRYCFGEIISIADLFLIPQVYNAKRYQCELDQFPLVTQIYDNCIKQSAFVNAQPENQPDFEP